MEELQYYLQGNKSELYIYNDRVVYMTKNLENKTKNYECIYFYEIKEVLVDLMDKKTEKIRFYIKGKGSVNCDEKVVDFILRKTYSKQEKLNVLTLKAFIDGQIRKNEVRNKIGDILTIEGIRKYNELLNEGIITQEEFNAKKKQLLGL